MGVHNNSNQFPNETESVKETGPVPTTFGNQATGFSSGFGRQSNTVFGTFPNQNNQQQQNNLAAFGSQNIFGRNSFNNTGFFQPNNFGFGCTMPQQTTKICFTGFGEPKTNYCFTNNFATMKRVTLIFEHPDTIFGSSIFKKPSTIVEIEALPLSNRSSWTSNNNNFSFSACSVEKYNSIFIMKSSNPIKFLVKVKANVGFNNTMSSSMNYENRKITLTFQSDQPQYVPNTNILRPMETIVEVPLQINKYDQMCTFSNDDFMFYAGPNGASNSFEVQTSKNAVFKITFAETGKHNNNQLFGNRQTRSGSVFFDQGRQMNAFPTTSGLLFGQAPSAFGGNQGFGSSTTSANFGLSSNQVQPMNSTQPMNGSLLAKPSVSNGSVFGTNQLFGSSKTGTVAGTCTNMVDKSRSHTGGFLFGQSNKCVDSQQTCGIGNRGASVFGQLFGNSEEETPTSIQPSPIGNTYSQPCGFGTNQLSFTNPSTLPDEGILVEGGVRNDFKSLHYQPTFGSDAIANQLGRVQTKTNCITAMNEYANESLEELRYQDYLRNSCETSNGNNTTKNPGRTEESANSNVNTFEGYSPSHNMIGNTNQAFFDQLHQLIPYLNAGSFCKCVRSGTNTAAKSQNNNSALANTQPRAHSDSLDHLYVNTQKPRLNDNMTIDEFYNDVFKYLEYIQKQYRHLESTLNNKNPSNIPVNQQSNKSETQKVEESNKTSNQHTHHTKSPMPVFGCSTYSAVNTSLNENTSLVVKPGSENDEQTVEKVSGIEPEKCSLFGTGDVSNKVALSTTQEPLEAAVATAIEQNLAKNSSTITSANSDDDAAKIKSKTEESIKGSTICTQTLSMLPFGASVNSSCENDSSTVSTVSNIFGSSAISANVTTLSSCSTTENTKNNNVEPTKSLLVGTDVNNKITLGTSKPFGLKFFSLPVPSQIPENTSTAPIFSTNDINPSSTGPIFTAKDISSNSTGSIFSTKDISSSSTGPIFSTKDISSNSIGSIFSTKDVTSSSTGSIFSTKDMSSSNAGSIFSAKDVSSNNAGSIFSAKDASSSNAGSIFSTKDVTFSSTGSIFSTKDVTSSNTGSIFSAKVVSSSNAGSIFSSKDVISSSTGSIFSIKDISSSSTGPSFSAKAISSSNAGSIFSAKDISTNSTGLIFSTKDTNSSNKLGNNSIGLFSFAVPNKIPKNTSTTSIFSTEDKSSSVKVGEKSTGFLSLNFPSSKPENTNFSTPIFSTKETTSTSTTAVEEKSVSSQIPDNMLSTVGENSTGFFSFNIPSKSIFAFKDTTSTSTVGGHNDKNKDEIESNAKTINLSKSDITESQANDADNGGICGGVNTIKADEPLKSFILYNKTQSLSPEEMIASTQKIDEPMDVQSGIVSSQQVFKMREISNILADINESEEKHKDSLSKCESDSDISNYSLISNRSANASPIQIEEHPTGIVMTRYGYYILPSLEDLKSQMTEDGACLVSNLTIGRKGYGSVCFNKEINVAGLNVDDIVHFRNKEIIIYPNKNTKPQVIADLKKCDVLVTLEQVWPHDEIKHEPIKDPQHLDKMKYENKLRLVCHRNDIHFVDYRPETGSWLFKMKQFTKSNINCWDVEDEDDTVENKSSSSGIFKHLQNTSLPSNKFSF